MLLSVEWRIRWGRIFGSDKTPRKKMGWTLELSFCATPTKLFVCNMRVSSCLGARPSC